MKHSEAPPPVVALKHGDTLDQVHPVELARQITLITQQMLNRVPHYELLMVRWTRPGSCFLSVACSLSHTSVGAAKLVLSANLMLCVDNTNQLTHWMATQVVSKLDVRERSLWIGRLIATGSEMLAHGNFNGLLQVRS